VSASQGDESESARTAGPPAPFVPGRERGTRAKDLGYGNNTVPGEFSG
jgi:hypothetical protein